MIELEKIRVLLVEDNPADVLTLRQYFADLYPTQFELHHVQRVADALDFLQAHSCDVVLLDLGLPDSRGIETFTRVHERAVEVPVLVLTGRDEEMVGASTLQRGAQDYLIKEQLQPPLLGKAIHYALERQKSLAELRLQAQQLQASEGRARALIEAAGDAVFVVAATGAVRLVNPAAERMLSRKASDLLSSVFPFPLAGEGTTEVEIVVQDGGKRVAEMRVAGMEWDGEPVQLAWLRDITERKRLEEALIWSEKMQALGTLAGGIAHDFNNILLVVSGNAKLALEQLPENHPACENVVEIVKAGSRATALTRKILSFSRQQETKRQAVPIQPLIEEALSMLRATLPARIEIHKNLSPHLPLICADASQLSQIIVNLATNATDAIGDRPGVLEVSASPIRLNGNGSSLSSKLPAGDYVKLSVKDTGTGIDTKTMGRVFEPFFTTKARGRGTGMGLAIVHGIMKNHLGEVTVYSEVGKGTVFNLYFPVAEEAPLEIQAVASTAPHGRGQHILYVDDEEPLVLLVTRTLKRLGYEVTGLTDPLEALRVLRQQPCSFHALVTDLSMPVMSGTDLAREALQACPRLPVILTTGYLRKQDQEVARCVGVREVILKPDTVEELGIVLHRLLGGAEGNSGQIQNSPESGHIQHSNRAGVS